MNITESVSESLIFVQSSFHKVGVIAALVFSSRILASRFLRWRFKFLLGNGDFGAVLRKNAAGIHPVFAQILRRWQLLSRLLSLTAIWKITCCCICFAGEQICSDSGARGVGGVKIDS